MLLGKSSLIAGGLASCLGVAVAGQVPLTDNYGIYEPQSKNIVINAELSGYVEHLMDLWGLKGVAVSVVRPDGEVEVGTWGIRTEDGERVTPDTLFGIASCSKAFLATSMGILIDDFAAGKNVTALPPGVSSLNWKTKVKDILPGEWELQDEWASEKANLQDILSHVSGLPRHDASYGPLDSPVDIVRRLKDLRPAFELRQQFSYNNQMYMIGAHIVSKYTGSYINYTVERIFGPTGMNSTTFSSSEAAKTGRLTQSWTAHGRRVPYWLPDTVKELLAGPGGIITSVVDLAKWMKVLLNSGVDPVTNATVIPEATFEAVTTSHTLIKGRGTPDSSLLGYGMGWMRQSYQGHEIIFHNGAIPGFSSMVAFLPTDNIGISILMNNGDKAEVTQALIFRITEDILKLRRIPRAEDPSASKPDHPRRSDNATTPIPLSAYAGTYGNAGYGSFTLCHPASDSSYCENVLADFNATDSAGSIPTPPNKEVPQLYGAWDRIWTSHIRLVHFKDDSFNASITALFPGGYGANKTAFETEEMDEYSGGVEFAVEDGKVVGFGFFEGVDAQRVGGVQERADAWFDKV